MSTSSSSPVTALGDYLKSVGGFFDDSLYGKKDSFGTSIYTSKSLPAGSKVVCCPFSLAVTPTLARQAVPTSLFPSHPSPPSARPSRQPNHELLALYLCLHLLPSPLASRIPDLDLQHRVYVDHLPSAASMRSTLYFSPDERELLRGSNLFGATEERERGWREELEEVKTWVLDEEVRGELSWERWLWACTILSSRAFPSSLIDGDKPNSTPVLFPGIDMLNHRPTSKVTWSSDVHVETVGTGADGKKGKGSLTIVLDEETPADEQVFNTYGAKSNEELLLGYGFTLPSNPADAVALRLSIPPSKLATLRPTFFALNLDNYLHFVPRSGAIPPALLAQMRLLVADPDEFETVRLAVEDELSLDDEYPGTWEDVLGFVGWENELNVLDALEGMLESKLNGLQTSGEASGEVRPDVREMVETYRESQMSILTAALETRYRLFEDALGQAEEEGVILASEDEEMEEVDEESEEDEE
ncbi:hypothetical protein JCM10207_007185 [Rhodosporidiobolus poonsookiae]